MNFIDFEIIKKAGLVLRPTTVQAGRACFDSVNNLKEDQIETLK